MADNKNPSDTIFGMCLDSKLPKEETPQIKSISTKLPPHTEGSVEDMDLWLHFLMETGILQQSSTLVSEIHQKNSESKDDMDFIIKFIEANGEDYYGAQKGNLRSDYETIHRQSPGKFYDTIEMDNPEAAFQKAKRILRDIVNSQKHLKPMFDIDFANMTKYASVQKKLTSIRNQIAPQRHFY